MKKLFLLLLISIGLSFYADAQTKIFPQLRWVRTLGKWQLQIDSASVGDWRTYATRDYVIGYVASAAAGAIPSVFGRTGAITAQSSDYSAFYPSLSGSYSNPSWINSLAFSKITFSGTSSQYVLGDGTLATKITNNNQLTNGSSYISNITGFLQEGSNITITGNGTIASPYVITSTGGGGGGSTNANIGSGYRWAVPTTNNIKTFFAGVGTLLDSSSNSNALTIKADTITLTTRDRTLKVADSLVTLPQSLYVQWPLKKLNDSTIYQSQGDATHDGYLDSADYVHFNQAYDKYTESGSYNSGTGIITFTRRDGTTWTVTGVTGGGGGSSQVARISSASITGGSSSITVSLNSELGNYSVFRIRLIDVDVNTDNVNLLAQVSTNNSTFVSSSYSWNMWYASNATPDASTSDGSIRLMNTFEADNTAHSYLEITIANPNSSIKYPHMSWWGSLQSSTQNTAYRFEGWGLSLAGVGKTTQVQFTLSGGATFDGGTIQLWGDQ